MYLHLNITKQQLWKTWGSFSSKWNVSVVPTTKQNVYKKNLKKEKYILISFVYFFSPK